MTTAEQVVHIRGAVGELFDCRDREILVDGPAGTGKSFGVCWYLLHLCIEYPGIRVLLSRKTRVSMSQTILVTWERVLGMAGYASVYAGASRSHRSGYKFPNGSEVVLFGFDDPERIKSSEYDVLYSNECTELTIDDWEVALSRLRHGVLPWQQAIADCNPGAPNHWLNVRANKGLMRRLVSRHEDNPHYFDGEAWTDVGHAYIFGVLDKLTGARKARLRHGLWVAAEGAVFEEVWDVAKHVIPEPDPRIFKGHVVGVDWGYRDPGVMTVWGWDGDKNAYRRRQVYRSGMTIEWWQHQARCIQRDFAPTLFTCDPSQPAHIEQFVLAGIPAEGADRSFLRRQATVLSSPPRGSIEVGLRLIEDRLREPSMFYVEQAVGAYDAAGVWHPGRDEALLERSHPTCSEEEYPLYSYHKTEDGKPNKEEPKDEYNHGIDADRYALTWISTMGDAEPDYTVWVDPEAM